jgi:DNA-binding NtrC family response regulator
MNLTPLSEAALIAEYNIIVETLKKTKFNKRKAAELLKIDPKTLYNRIDEYHNMIAIKEANKDSISETY